MNERVVLVELSRLVKQALFSKTRAYVEKRADVLEHKQSNGAACGGQRHVDSNLTYGWPVG